MTEVFVQNEKGTEYVGTVECEEATLPSKIIFDDYSRDADVLSESQWPERTEWKGKVVTLTQTAGKVVESRPEMVDCLVSAVPGLPGRRSSSWRGET